MLLLRYLLRRLLPSVALAIVLCTAGVLLLFLLRFGPSLASAGASPGVALGLFAWAAIPAVGAALGPAALIGGVVALRRMSDESEIAALRSLGVRPGALATPALLVALAVGLAAGAISLSAAPSALGALRARLSRIAVHGIAHAIDAAPIGRFSSPANDVHVFVRASDARGVRGLLVEADGVVVAARHGHAWARGGAIRLDLRDAVVRAGPGRQLSARRAVVTLPSSPVARAAADAVPSAFATPTGALARTRAPQARRVLASRIAAPAIAAALALWMLPLGFGGRRRMLAIPIAGGVIAAAHVVPRLVEAASFPPLCAAATPTGLALAAVAAWRRVR